MKRILITGANSYIGTSFENYINQWSDKYQVDTVDMVDGTWREKSFEGYDVVFHVAGIAHSDNGKITFAKEQLYYRVNTDLAVETAKKAKNEGIKQFIFMSSIIVYGDSAPIGKTKIIDKTTPLSPANCYGDSKVQAEKGLLLLEDERFKIVILRPPMIYGKGCKGNYSLLSEFVKKIPFFPQINNQRSMLYIDNLSEFIRLIIKNEERGIFFPQNKEYVNTSLLVKTIAEVNRKKTILIKGTETLLIIVSKRLGLINKVFGNLCYEISMGKYKENYQVCDFKESIKYTEIR